MVKHTHYKKIEYKRRLNAEKRKRKIKKIALINTPKSLNLPVGNEYGVDNSYPIGLLHVSAALKEDGHMV
ncbi:unnamed protein product, partial [marine sediment metagenome]